MPRLLRRAVAGGAILERHYATAPTTYFAVFSALFGLEAHKLDAVAGAGRRPLLFGAFQANGYRTRLIASSSVEWMGLKESVFGDVQGDLENEFPGNFQGEARDAEALRRAREWVGAQDERPLFLFVFLVGTHFNYTYPPRSARFPTTWDGSGLIRLTQAPADQILNRARNSAYEMDWKVDEFLDWFGQRRGKTPLVIVTGDHGEEMREHGRVGHGSSVEAPQIHVPMVVLGDGVPRGRRDVPTSHVDIVPTLFRLLGDEHPPALYSDGLSMFEVPEDRFVLATVGWEPRFAAIGKDLKVSFFGMDAGFGGVSITDPDDRPLPDGEERFAARAGSILRLFGRDGRAAAPAAAGLAR
jgi:membrane-anchored protein YejM (alkaline phosphatase superfamily)